MTCRDCHRFDVESKRCKDGKVNPQSYSDSFEVARYLGLRSICVFNDFREQLLFNRKGGASRAK